MQVTEQYIEELMQHAMAKAKEHREKAGFSGGFMPLAIVVGPNGEQGLVPTPYKNRDDKHTMMAALAFAAREASATAVVIVSDTRMVDLPKFATYFNIPTPEMMDQEKWEVIYADVLEKQFGGNIQNLPKELLTDALIVAAKGPFVREHVLTTSYRESVGDTLVFGETTSMGTKVMMLDDWWDALPVN
jgi:hypothetical protein